MKREETKIINSIIIKSFESMKKNFTHALLTAIAITGATGFISCASNDDVADVNPTYNDVEKTVTTQFVLNIAAGEMPETRQSTTTVQKNSNFRGMKDAKLIGLSTGQTSYLAPFAGNSEDYAVKKTYDLGTLYSSTAVNNTGEKNATESSHRVLELTLPLTTDAMLVYGRAIPGNDDEENGKVVYNVDATPENTTFDLVSRITDANKYTQTCNLFALILNRIMLSEIKENVLL